jgi:catalase
MKDGNSAFDFLAGTPESAHQVTILFSDRGTPKDHRHMNGYSSHTFKWVNKEGDQFFIKMHFKTDAGI